MKSRTRVKQTSSSKSKSTNPSLPKWQDVNYLKAHFRATILENQWIPHQPTLKQAEFLLMPDLEVLFGGSAGGGKSDALLMAALQYADVPGYAAILFRRTYADLALPGALMDRSQEWLRGTAAHWSDKTKTWTFPSGATLSFGYLESENDKYRYQSAEFQFVGFDELTQFTETQYRYLFSRLRRLEQMEVPLRMRAASNPGGVGHEWVKQRFIVGDRPFVPASLDDNPYIDRVEYVKSLMHLDPVTREQLLRGDWTIQEGGTMFKREWFEIVPAAPAGINLVRYWDMAATEAKPGKDPDYTSGCLMGEKDGIYYIIDIKRDRLSPLGVENLIKQTAILDGKRVPIWLEQEPGSSGKTVIDHYAREVLKGFIFRGDRVTGSKTQRAQPLSAAAEMGNVKLVQGKWIPAFLDEAEVFPFGLHDDQVDSASGAMSKLTAVTRPLIARA